SFLSKKGSQDTAARTARTASLLCRAAPSSRWTTSLDLPTRQRLPRLAAPYLASLPTPPWARLSPSASACPAGLIHFCPILLHTSFLLSPVRVDSRLEAVLRGRAIKGIQFLKRQGRVAA